METSFLIGLSPSPCHCLPPGAPWGLRGAVWEPATGGSLLPVPPPVPYCFMYELIIFLSFLFLKMWTIFKVFVEFVSIFLLFYVLVFWPQGI